MRAFSIARFLTVAHKAMPELPEVETTRRGIVPYLKGRRIHELVVREPRLRWPVPADLAERIRGQVLRDVERRAKYLLFRFDNGTMIGHLGMSGSMRILTGALPPPRKHDHIDLLTDDGSCLRFHDPRRFGALLWSDGDPQAHELLRALGPEPLGDDFDARRLYKMSRGRKAPVKNFIMDNHVVVGVGNIYANEALYAAGIHPLRQAGRISLTRYQRLTDEIRRVLARSIETGGTTLRDYVNGDGMPGYFALSLAVYGRDGETCPACSETIRLTRCGQRSTFFCPQCQR